jgi:hypothetical protein
MDKALPPPAQSLSTWGVHPDDQRRFSVECSLPSIPVLMNQAAALITQAADYPQLTKILRSAQAAIHASASDPRGLCHSQSISLFMEAQELSSKGSKRYLWEGQDIIETFFKKDIIPLLTEESIKHIALHILDNNLENAKRKLDLLKEFKDHGIVQNHTKGDYILLLQNQVDLFPKFTNKKLIGTFKPYIKQPDQFFQLYGSYRRFPKINERNKTYLNTVIHIDNFFQKVLARDLALSNIA